MDESLRAFLDRVRASVMSFELSRMKAPSLKAYDYFYVARDIAGRQARKYQQALTFALLGIYVVYVIVVVLILPQPVSNSILVALFLGAYLMGITRPLFYGLFRLRLRIIDNTYYNRYRTSVLSELVLIGNFYTALKGLSRFTGKIPGIEESLQELEKLEKEIATPNAVRKTISGFLSSAGGISGVATIVFAGGFLASINQLTNAIGALQTWILGVLFGVPVFFLVIMIVEPVFKGIRKAEKFYETLRERETPLKEAMQQTYEATGTE